VKAVVLARYGGPDVLEIRDVDPPVPGPDEIVVDVTGSALNRADVLQRMGLYADPRRAAGSTAPEIPGLEYAGRVAAVGARVTDWVIGDAVMGIEAGGCYAEQVATHARMAMAVPEGVDLADAAAIPEVFLTAWDALVVQGGLTSGRWALVHAGASGVGTAAIQIARAVGARVAVTCSVGKAGACRDLGADLVLDRSPADWPAALRDGLAAAGRTDGVDVVLDVIGGEEADRNLAAVRPKGTIVQVGLMGGGSATVNLGLLLTKRARWIGTVLRSRPVEEKIAVSRRFADEVLPSFTAGALHPVVDRRFPLDAVADAHRHMEADANVGKIVLQVTPS
jgi:putative PIG3 family NAD(P)H quinone oxidoreductase